MPYLNSATKPNEINSSLGPLKVINLSVGNIPSLEANSIQTMKMSNAFSKICNAFELITYGDIFHALRIKKTNLFEFYDVDKFKITILPMKLWYKYPHRNDYRDDTFNKYAPLYCSLKKRSHIVYTRKPFFMIQCLKRGMKTVLEYHHDLEDKYIQSKFLNSPNFLGIIVISELIKRRLEKKGIDGNKIIVLQSGVDIDRFKNVHFSIDQARTRLKLPLNKRIILYSGHLYEFKGIPLLMELAKMMPNILFVLVGGLKDDILRWSKITEKMALKNIILSGSKTQKEVPIYLKAADILLLPNSGKHDWSETTSPLKLFEYMASGRPIIASKLKNIQNVIQHEKSGLLAQPDDPESFKIHINKLIKNEPLGRMLAKEALNKVEMYSWDRRAQRILSFLTANLNNLHPF